MIDTWYNMSEIDDLLNTVGISSTTQIASRIQEATANTSTVQSMPNEAFDEVLDEFGFNDNSENTEEIEGKAIIAEQIPVGFKFVNAKEEGWTQKDGKYLKTTDVIEPGKTVEYEVILRTSLQSDGG